MAGSLIAGLSFVPASAVEDSEPLTVEQLAAQVVAASPDSAEAVVGEATLAGVSVKADSTTTTIPLDGSDPIAVSALVDGVQLDTTISLPSNLRVGNGEVASDGTVVYQSADDSGAVAVQGLEEGQTRIQTIIPDSGAQHEFGYAMDGFQPAVADDGSVSFVAQGGEGAVVPVEAAWATDANGAAVETYYEVRGDELFQVVVPTASTAYPIVADPTWGWRNAAWGLTLSRSETAGIKDYAAAAGMCATIAKAAPAFAVACGVWWLFAVRGE